MTTRRQKRIRETSDEFEEVLAQEKLSSKPDEDLFVLDKTGSRSKRVKIQQQLQQQKQQPVVSRHELHLIQKVLKNSSKKTDNTNNNTKDISDLWSDDTPVPPSKYISNNKVRRDRLVHPGQSYNPSLPDHQDALAEAVAVEIKKTEANSNTNILVEVVSAIATADDDDDDNDNNNNDDSSSPLVVRPKSKSKLTRAQRNKIRLRKQRDTQTLKEQTDRLVLRSIDGLPRLLSSLQDKETKLDLRRQIKQTQTDLRLAKKTVVPYMTYQEAAAVPLSDELSGSMRTLRPKGTLSLSLEDMKTRGVLPLSDKRMKTKKRDKPHAERNVKWHSKYKIQ